MRSALGGPALVLLCLCACGGSERAADQTSPSARATPQSTSTAGETTTAPPEAEAGVALVPMPDEARRTCRGSARLRRVCPALVPEAPYGERPEVFVAELLPAERGSPAAFNLHWGAETPGRPERNRPPRLSHVVVIAADPGGALRGVEARALRRATWAGREGTLLRAAPFPRGGLHGDHLIFRWREGRREYAVSLHAWEPARESVETLEAIVASTP